MSPRFSLRDVSVQIGDRCVLDRVDVDLAEPGVTVLSGPSGSGKSTLLRLLNRLDLPTGGDIRLDGQSLADHDACELRRTVAMAFQRPPIFPGTVLDNLRVADPSLSPDDARSACRRVLLPEAIVDQDARTLSGGEAQRMAIARALLTEPEVLLADEPTSALDDEARDGIERLVRGLADDGLRVVWVSHDGAQVQRLADRVVKIANGQVVT